MEMKSCMNSIIKNVATAAVCMSALCMVAACTKSETAADASQEISTEYIEEQSSTYAALEASSQSKFSSDDMVFDKASYGMTPDEVIALLGTPDEDKEDSTSGTMRRVLTYNGANDKKSTLVFENVGGTLKLCGIESNDPARTFARQTQVGMKADDARDKFYRDENCLNSNVMSEDNATILGKFLYGTSTIDRLEEQKLTGALEYGIINYNGNDMLEQGGSILEYMSLVPPYKSEYASYNDDYAQLMYYTGADGTVTKICWYYYPEIS